MKCDLNISQRRMSRETGCLFLLVLLLGASEQGLSDVSECSCYEGELDPPPSCSTPDRTEQCDPGTKYCFYRRHYHTGIVDPVEDRGCLHDLGDEFVRTICEEMLNNHDRDQWYCCETNNCNDALIDFTLPAERVEETGTPQTTSDGNSTSEIDNSHHVRLNLIISLPIVSTFTISLIILFLVIIALLRCRKKRRDPRRRRHQTSKDCEISPEPGIIDGTTYGLEEMSCTSGSGSGLPFLIQRTVARSIRIGESIGSGRYGQVFVGEYQGESVAVKKFASRDELSWFRETEIYNTCLLRHDNILGFFASDMISNNGVTELWLITQYHPFGSLFDYLNQETISPRVLFQLATSMCSGLSHLHQGLQGTIYKPPIAHRDIKSKNILVKSNLTCCIADFGLAVVQNSNTVNMPNNPKQGTKRYMAPEILNETINMLYFESFKQTDVYATGLVLWEMCRRCGTKRGQALEYELPFQGLVPPDPTFDEMKRIVVLEKRQPSIPNKWHQDDLFKGMTQLMRECWYFNSSARPTALYLKKKLAKLSQEDKLDFDEHE